MGLDGPREVKEHPWLKTYPWSKLHNKELESPFIPTDSDFIMKDVGDKKGNNWEDENDEILKQNAVLLRRNSVQGNLIFLGVLFA